MVAFFCTLLPEHVKPVLTAQMYGRKFSSRTPHRHQCPMRQDKEAFKRSARSWDSEGEAMVTASTFDSRVTVPLSEGPCADVHWYAVSTRSRHEKMVRDRLAGIGVEPFLPLTRTLNQWSDRKVWTENPLFSGYCFARFSLMNSHAILQTPGIVRIVGSVRPEPIPDEEVKAIMKLAESARSLERHDYLTEGAWVEVVRGPLTGLRGQLLRKGGHDCLVIRVHLIQQAATVHIDMREVIPVQ
ncbi:MAG: UpxY family transcription antiterminator [Nitrospira sp. CR1.1]|jgi:transcription antitermination factor NusG|nr:UpxY family transcription antiterminator [Nitrospira sp. CR1.1]